MKKFTFIIVLNIFFLKSYAQTLAVPDPIELAQHKAILQQKAQQGYDAYPAYKKTLDSLAEELGIPIRKELRNGGAMVLQGFTDGDIPIYYITHNKGAAATISVNSAQDIFGLTGKTITIGLWDDGLPKDSHIEINDKVVFGKESDDINPSAGIHPTHTSGTMIAIGDNPEAKGMAPKADIIAYDFNNDLAEINKAAGDNLLISCHPYGWGSGWQDVSKPGDPPDWQWFGDLEIDAIEDYKFGFYDSRSEQLDIITQLAPYYLIVTSAGNDRNDKDPENNLPEPDGGDEGYDCISTYSGSKNILTIGAVDDINGGYQNENDVVMTDFSSWGPTDDGRIKPDIVANGVSVLSSYDVNGQIPIYETLNGTSMASASATGGAALLIEHQRKLYSNISESKGYPYRSSTLKGLIIHTADEAGLHDGPDYQFGWGLMNIYKAASLMEKDADQCINIREYDLFSGGEVTLPILKQNTDEPLKVTICWTDPPHQGLEPELNPTIKTLINDLDLRVLENGGQIFKPWVLGGLANPSAPATTGDNNTDNVEQVVIPKDETGHFTIKISHKGMLEGSKQVVSVIISGSDNIPENVIDNKVYNQPPPEWVVAENTITTIDNCQVMQNAEVTYKAGKRVLLKPGFKAKAGSRFLAQIEQQYTCMQGVFNNNENANLDENNWMRYKEDNLYAATIERETDIKAFPNPFHNKINFKYTLEDDRTIRLLIYDIYGRLVDQKSQKQIAGNNHLVYEGEGLASGMYVYKIYIDNDPVAGRIIKK